MTDWIFMVLEMFADMYLKWRASSLGGSNQRGYRRRKSIVRTIGSWLPLSKARRVHLDLAVWKHDNPFQHIAIDGHSISTISDSDEGHETLCYSNGENMENNAMKKLLEEILELKMKMNEILEKQTTNTCCSKLACCTIDSGDKHPRRSENQSVAAPLPPPPPPPPPMPNNILVAPAACVPPTIRKKSAAAGVDEATKPAGLSAVLNELKSSRVLLKPVLKSPGGRPLKSNYSDSDSPGYDTGNSLADILRRRYALSEAIELGTSADQKADIFSVARNHQSV